ncbi:two pore domain potassium channel family protein [Clostridium sp. P21]|uniref:Two pore domain potassium channel family protein n=1 Tax=Clostridium muellerianum TaxID=2716538 RepID=A0A7Y0ED05_9CLOT|nr:potassium channel family protein [Clostridium muellerianum]NMM61193.1 two pore domain potassium channel family protein [Clostridium muellerianum]
MDELSYLKLIPMLFILLVVTIPTVIYVFVKKVRIFKRVLFIYFFVSMLIIFIFAFFYMTVVLVDIQNFKHQYPNLLSALDITKEKKQEIFNGFLHIKGINVSDYKGSFILFFLDLLYFSSMTFFTVGYGDITVVGIVRIVSILEGFLGVAMTGIIISMVLSNSIEMSKKEDRLRMFIFRGYDILYFEKTSFNKGLGLSLLEVFSEKLSTKMFKKYNKDLYHVHLIDSNGKVAMIHYINLNDEARETFEKFEITWDFIDYRNKNIEYYYKFAQCLMYKLRKKIDVGLEVELYKFIKTDKKINLFEFKEFLIKLKKSLINKRIDDIRLNNDIIDLTTKCIYGIDKINENI